MFIVKFICDAYCFFPLSIHYFQWILGDFLRLFALSLLRVRIFSTVLVPADQVSSNGFLPVAACCSLPSSMISSKRVFPLAVARTL